LICNDQEEEYTVGIIGGAAEKVHPQDNAVNLEEPLL